MGAVELLEVVPHSFVNLFVITTQLSHHG